MNGFHPSPYFPYLHMGVNGLNSMMPQPVSMAIASAQAQLAMRADPAANKDAKALMEQQEFLSRYDTGSEAICWSFMYLTLACQ